MVANDSRGFGAHTAIRGMLTQQIEGECQFSPCRVRWNENERELYVVTVDADIWRVIKAHATLSSIRRAPAPITNDCTPSAASRHLRRISSIHMDISYWVLFCGLILPSFGFCEGCFCLLSVTK